MGAAAGSSRQQAAGSRQPQAAAGSRQPQAAAGSRRQQQAAAGSSRQQRASSQPRETYSKLFVGDFRRDVPASGNAYFGLRSCRAMVFPHPAGPCLCGHSSSSGGGSSSSGGAAAAAAAAAGSSREQQAAAGSSRQQQTIHLICHFAWGHVRPFGFLCLLRILPDSLVVWIQYRVYIYISIYLSNYYTVA